MAAKGDLDTLMVLARDVRRLLTAETRDEEERLSLMLDDPGTFQVAFEPQERRTVTLDQPLNFIQLDLSADN